MKLIYQLIKQRNYLGHERLPLHLLFSSVSYYSQSLFSDTIFSTNNMEN